MPRSQGYFDLAGITYFLTGGVDVNLYSFSDAEALIIENGNSFLTPTLDSFVLTPAPVTATPEPSSLSLFALTLGSIVIATRKRLFVS